MKWLSNLFKGKKNYRVSFSYKCDGMEEENTQTIAYVKARNGEEAIDITKKLIEQKKVSDWDSALYWLSQVKNSNDGYFDFCYTEFEFIN